jgi:hypothetical protein
MTARPIRLCLTAIAVATLLASCAPSPEAARCRRVNVVSMGPENGFRTSLAGDPQQKIAAPAGRIDVALTTAAALTGPVTLVQSLDGREVSRWEIKPPPSSATVRRCSIGFAASADSCGPVIAAPSYSIAGDWAVVPGDNRLLEASVSFHVCD